MCVCFRNFNMKKWVTWHKVNRTHFIVCNFQPNRTRLAFLFPKKGGPINQIEGSKWYFELMLWSISKFPALPIVVQNFNWISKCKMKNFSPPHFFYRALPLPSKYYLVISPNYLNIWYFWIVDIEHRWTLDILQFAWKRLNFLINIVHFNESPSSNLVIWWVVLYFLTQSYKISYK